jgi:hypothetical protein
MMNDDDKLRADDPASVQVLRNILTAAEAAYEPEDRDGRLWADAIDRTRAYRPDALDAPSDPMARASSARFATDSSCGNKLFLEIIKELETDRDRLTRILSLLEDERQKRSSELSATHQTHG